ncbi:MULTISPECIES: hypothetical protein [Nostoc]|uniref:Uncharacterized protein n=1 Tax=Nostoc paludosum FACHB-159 TaxID=2692908 RepID=A0ABR8KHM0_9NOSO|nr:MULTISPECIES: hypothetical protein [Nostoc]MBD2681900.1 hypothetical protein [Nostoc sp. FACHB-857]MBD2738271.1 hypothetical protein [Nostoc paludosum FACHB-159]
MQRSHHSMIDFSILRRSRTLPLNWKPPHHLLQLHRLPIGCIHGPIRHRQHNPLPPRPRELCADILYKRLLKLRTSAIAFSSRPVRMRSP